MKKIPLLLMLLFSLFACERHPVELTTVKDHEGNEYEIKTYGSQTWMVENMRATTTKDGKNILKCPANGRFSYDEPMVYYMLDDEEYTTKGRGCLYNYAAARNICPDGWHLPSVDDWQTLVDYVKREYTGMYNGDTITVAKAMASKYNWNTSDSLVGAPGYHAATNNSSEFNLRPAGDYISPSETGDNPDFYNYGWRSTLWSSTPSADRYDANYLFQIRNYSDSCFKVDRTIFQGYSVRCVKNN